MEQEGEYGSWNFKSEKLRSRELESVELGSRERRSCDVASGDFGPSSNQENCGWRLAELVPGELGSCRSGQADLVRWLDRTGEFWLRKLWPEELESKTLMSGQGSGELESGRSVQGAHGML